MVTKTVKVSVIIALYNTEQYIAKCINSALSQTYGNIEIIVVNDGSTDNSRLVCENFKNEPRLAIFDKPNGGLSSARQYGFNNARGEYVCFIDADDYLDKYFVEKMLNRICAMNADICICLTNFIGIDKITVYGHPLNYDKYITTRQSLIDNYIEQCSLFYMSDSWNKLYRTSFISNAGVNFELPNKMNGTDLLFNHKLALHCPTYTTCNEPLYNHITFNESSVRRKGKKLLLSYNYIIQKLIQEAERIGVLNEISPHLKTKYMQFLRDGLLDSIIESNDGQHILTLIDDAIKLYKSTTQDYPIIDEAAAIRSSPSLNLFIKCFGHKLWTHCYFTFYVKITMLRNRLVRL